jgi:hypothetical protein
VEVDDCMYHTCSIDDAVDQNSVENNYYWVSARSDVQPGEVLKRRESDEKKSTVDYKVGKQSTSDRKQDKKPQCWEV